MTKTNENLRKAFAGESMANRKYLAYAEKAEKEGYLDIANLFRKHAEEETAHALAHLEKLGIVKSTKENLEEAIAGETNEYQEMYPEFAKQARDESNEIAAKYFESLAEVESHHAEEYYKALKRLEGKQLKWRCDICGYIHIGEEPPERCPRCGASKEHFHIVE